MEQPSVGTDLKINVGLDIGSSITMDDAEFVVQFYNDRKSVTVVKENMIRVDANNYVARLDTSLLGAGEIFAKVTTYVPDADFASGIRREVMRASTGIKIVS